MTGDEHQANITVDDTRSPEAGLFRLCSARARKTAKDAHHQPPVLYEVRQAVTNKVLITDDQAQQHQIYEGPNQIRMVMACQPLKR